MSLTWLLRRRPQPVRAFRNSSHGRSSAKLRVEELEKRELLDAASGMRPTIREAGPAPIFDQSNFIAGLYYDLLHRQPQEAEVAAWNSALGAGVSKVQVVQGFESSDEYLLDQVQEDYQTFLGRNADPAGAQAWLQALKQGTSPQDLMAAFVASDEYYQNQGGTLQAWVNALYRDVLGRVADPTGLAAWVQSLQNGASRSSVALAFVQSQEEDVQLVTGVYENLLGRLPDAAGLEHWVAALGNGLTLAQLNTLFATSAEYLNRQQSIDYVDSGGIGGTATSTNGTGSNVSNQIDRFDNKAQTSSTLTVGPNVDVNRETGDQTEETIAVDPNNPQRIFVASNENNLLAGMMASYSTDGGATWTPYVIGTGPRGDGLPFAVSDPWASWDQFGNLFFTYIAQPELNSIQLDLNVLLSTNGGKTFSLLTTIPVNDHPEVATGAGYVAVTYNTGSPRTPAGQVAVALASVAGLGQVGPFFQLIVPGSDQKNFGDIAIGPAGQIVAAFQSNTSGPGPDTAEVSLDPNVLGSAKFGIPTVASSLKVGGFRPIPPQPVRTVTANVEIAYDLSNGPHRGRLYLCYANAANITTSDLNIFVRYSDDDGRTWSQPVQVNDDTGKAVHFFPAIAVDQTTGNVGVAWYDTRNDTGNTSGGRPHKPNTDVEVFAAVSTDGGVTFSPNVQVASGPSNATLNNDTFGNDFGDYLGLAYSHGILYPAWADNSTTLVGNPSLPNFDIAIAQVIGPGAASSSSGSTTGSGSTGGTPFVPRPTDRFDPNENSAEAFFFGDLSAGTQTISNLLISRLPNGQIDNNWWRWQAGQSGTFTIQINYQPYTSGDLNLRLFTLNSQNDLVQVGSSQATGVTGQKVSVTVTAGESLYAWVYGFDHAEAAYQMAITLT
jgi:hypothetical protein